MLEKLSTETLEAIFDTLPVDITFVDDADTVRYYSRGDARIFRRTPAVIGRKVQDCHPQKSLHKVYIRYFAVRDKAGKYIGTLEVTQDITGLQKIEGEKRLLDTE